MSDQAYENMARGTYRNTTHAAPPTYDSVESDDDIALARLTDEIREDMLGELRHEDLAEIITQEYELHETDLYAKLLTAIAAWNEKPETAYERMQVIDRLVHLAMDKIAEREARKALDL